MKKILLISLITILAVGLVGCNNKDVEVDNSNNVIESGNNNSENNNTNDESNNLEEDKELENNEVESGENLTKSQKKFHGKTVKRDLALMTLLLGTGIRVSECVGLDIQDVDFKNNGIKVTRKGGNEMIVYFSDEVADALIEYIETDRKFIQPLSGHENALFLSTQKRRMGVQAVENMVKKGYDMNI